MCSLTSLSITFHTPSVQSPVVWFLYNSHNWHYFCNNANFLLSLKSCGSFSCFIKTFLVKKIYTFVCFLYQVKYTFRQPKDQMEAGENQGRSKRATFHKRKCLCKCVIFQKRTSLQQDVIFHRRKSPCNDVIIGLRNGCLRW